MRPLLALLLLSALGCVSAPEDWVKPGVHRGELIVDGRDRSFVLHVPEKAVAAQQRVPLVLVLHGGGGVARKTGRFTGFDELAEREGFLLACPQGIGRQWNDGRALTEGEAHRERVPDVAFLRRLVAALVEHLPVDRRRIYVTGISNGASMTFRLICEATELFAAAAPVINSMPVGLKERATPQGPLPLLILAGDADPLIPYSGGPIRVLGETRGAVIPIPEAARWWAKHNGCAPSPTVERLPDRAPDDETRVRRAVWSGGAAPVELWTIEGGGHTWPGGAWGFEWLFSSVVGVESEELDAAETIWAFFRRHARPEQPERSAQSKPSGQSRK